MSPVKSPHPKSSRTDFPERLKNVPSSLYDDPAFSSDPTLHPYFVANHSSHVSSTLPHPRHLKADGKGSRGKPAHTSGMSASSFRDLPTFPLPSTSLDGQIATPRTPWSVSTKSSYTPSPSATGYSPGNMRPAPLTDSSAEFSGTRRNLTLDGEVVSFSGNTGLPALPLLPVPSRLSAQKQSGRRPPPPPYTEMPNAMSFIRSGGVRVPLHNQGSEVSSSVSDVACIHGSRDKKVLDRIDELDETNPLGISLHHESPYEAISRLVQPIHPSGRNTAGRGTDGMYRNEHLTAPNVHTPSHSVAGASLNLPPGAFSFQPEVVQSPVMESKDANSASINAYADDIHMSTMGHSGPRNHWNTIDGTSEPYPSSTILRVNAKQYVEFDPYDPVNLEGPITARRNLQSTHNEEYGLPINQGLLTSTHTGSNEKVQNTGSIWRSIDGRGDTDYPNQSMQHDQLLQSGMKSAQVIDSNSVARVDNKTVSMHLRTSSANGTGTNSQQPSLIDGRSMIQYIKSSSGSSQISRLSGKPQSRYLPKKLVMPAPLQSSVVVAPTFNQEMDNKQPGITLHRRMVHQPSFIPTGSDKSSVGKAQDIPTSVARKLRKRTTSTVTPTVGVNNFQGVRFADAPSISITENELRHSVPLAAKKRVLSKKRVGV
ncbi:hypothetical protein BDQ17DRAFT_1341285 [Cyathus striatus]|nr:hypothetical protein BDQ17DRAFT_1341285 [Cyathus striatus]